MANGNYQNVGYSLGQSPLTTLSSLPVVAKRAPTTADLNYQIGQLWIWSANNTAYILASVVSNQATWITFAAGGGAGIFTTLTSTSATTLATTNAGTNSFGNTTGATALNLLVGTGNFTLDGVGASTYTIGAATTTGTISIGGTAQTGTLTLAGGTAAQTVNIAASTGVKTINIGTGAAANQIIIGTTTTTAATTIRAGSGGITLTGNTAVTGTLSSTGIISAATGSAVTAGGAAYINVGTGVTSPQIIAGSGAPTFVATKGSLYLRTDGTTTNDRAYIAVDNAGTWTALTTAA